MLRRIRDEWCQKLRSGDYKQTQEALHRAYNNEHSYCCLGVFCDVMGEKWSVAEQEENEILYAIRYKEDIKNPYTTVLTTDLNRIINGTDNLDKQYVSHLIHMNDNGSTFEEIADWIEANIPVEEELINVASS